MVTVVDAFGMPVAEAGVQHYLGSDGSAYGQTNREGTVTLDVPAGAGRVVANSGIFGWQEVAVGLAPDGREELRLTLVPWWSDSVFAVLGAEVVPGSVAADGRSLELRIEMAGSGQLYSWSFLPEPCIPRVDGELATLGPACLDRGDGTDLGWKYAGEVRVGAFTTKSDEPAGPVMVLLDRSQTAGELDGREEHLFAAKALVAKLLEDHSVGVGAFAGDGGASGTASPLPEKPVTYFPVENPGWITDRVAAFEALESLRGLAGGSPALAAAIESGTDFLLARTAATDRPALVVVTAGGSERCSLDESTGPDAISQCTAVRAASERARKAGVALWLIGPGDSWSSSPWYSSPVSNASGGSLTSVARESRASWAPVVVMGDAHAASALVDMALSAAPTFREVRFRISTDEPGAFAPGVEIGGDLTIFDNGWGFWVQRFPFRATVPAAGP